MTRVLWCVLGCRQELPLCAQVIFFPGISGQGLVFLNTCERCGVGESAVLFQEMHQCPFGERRHSSPHLRNNGIHFRDAAYEVCLWVRSDNRGWCYTTQGMGLASERKEVGPGSHPWHSPIIKNRWHGEEKNDSAAVFTVAYDCCGHFESGRKWAGVIWRWGNSWGAERDNTLCRCFVWHKRLLTATVNQELCQGSQVSSGIWLRSTQRGSKCPGARLEVSP